MQNRPTVIDCWINPITSAPPRATYLFPGSKEKMTRPLTPEEYIAVMDESGIEKGLLAYGAGTMGKEDNEWVLKAAERHPDRFVLTVSVDPRKGIETVRQLEKWVRDYNCRAFRLLGFDIQKPYNDKIYYPVYSKCIELDIPVTCNVGIPAPRLPGEVQNPIYLDEVCWFFPELKIVMTHGGEPWAFTCVKLMLKWENLYYMTSAFAPKYYPPEIVHYMNTRGSDKVMFASDFPLVPFDRCMREVKELGLKENVLPRFLRENALRVFKL